MKVFKKLKLNYEYKIKKNMNQVMIMTADNLYEKSIKFKIFY
jgi:hypothetical protein